MADKSKIEWTEATWSPVVGCTRVSAGCDNCYAVRQTRRLAAMGQEKYAGLVNEGKGHFNGVARMHVPALDLPLRWKRGRRIFVNPMSDLFHERLPFEAIGAVFGIMAAAPQHTFQVLTKRPERALEWCRWIDTQAAGMFGLRSDRLAILRSAAGLKLPGHPALQGSDLHAGGMDWPLPNVWLGVSAEDQATADERIPLLLQCPAAIRFVSYEPALGPVNFKRFMPRPLFHCAECGQEKRRSECRKCGTFDNPASNEFGGLDWIIVGGESGPGARPFDVAWARSTVEQCKAASVACFVKQLGRRVLGSPPDALVDRYVMTDGSEWQPPIIGFDRRRFERDNADRIIGFKLFDSKGGDMSEWPEDLRVRQFPTAGRNDG